MSALTSPSCQSTADKTKTALSSNRDKDSKLQIFLGGSCNPTTWRQNVAIPYLELNNISYYNPQIDDWTPEVVDTERHAKQTAQILLFVIDKQTRSTVSLVESAFMAGESKNLVLVIYPFEYNIMSLTDTSHQTSNIIESRSKFVKKTSRLCENDCPSEGRSSSTVTSSSTSVSSSATTAHETSPPSTTLVTSTRTVLSSARIRERVDTENFEIERRQLEASHEKSKQASEIMRISDEIISLGEFQELKQARHILQKLIDIQRIPIFSDILQALNYVSYRVNGDFSPRPPQKELSRYTDFLSKFYAETDTSLTIEQCKKDNLVRDIYLSLDSDDQSFTETMVLPILKEKGLSYNYMSVDCLKLPNNIHTNYASSESVILPKQNDESLITAESNELIRHMGVSEPSEHTRLAIEKELYAIRSSRVLLFVITNKCRGLSIMVLASHFMALFRKNVVLCVQYLEEPCSIGGEALTKAAIADYNRGRVYLCDYAIKSQVPVFSSVEEAIDCCSMKCCRGNK